jgi:hypothetical protein
MRWTGLFIVLASFALTAEAEVRKEHLMYLKGWKPGYTSAKAVKELGVPDYVVLPTDPT